MSGQDSPSASGADRLVPVDQRIAEELEAGTLPTDLLICGPAGTGKTYGILKALHMLASGVPNLRILFCRATRSSLTESVLVTFEQEILPADGMEWLSIGVQRRVRQSYRYPNGSEIVLGGLDNPVKILSTAWDLVYINEAIEVTEDAWETLKSRLGRPGRDPNLGILIGDTNPGNPSHWLKARADAGKTVLWDTGHQANPALYDHDAGRWTVAGLNYLAQLDELTGTRRARLRDGLWAVGEGLWFEGFDPATHVSESADYDPARPVCVAVDPGVFTGAVFFQADHATRSANVFGDYLTEGKSAEANARAILQTLETLCGGRLDRGYCDPAGGARTAVGPVVLDIYRKEGLALKPWPLSPVADGLELIESLLSRATLKIHPRCRRLVNAFQGYARAKRANQWMDYPEDPQHPHEDVMDALRGGLYATFPARKTLRLTGVN